MTELNKYSKYYDWDTTLVAGMLMLVVVSLMVPYGALLFAPSLFLFAIYFFLTRRSFDWPKMPWWLILVAFFYLLGLAQSEKFYGLNRFGLLNLLSCFGFGFAVWNICTDHATIRLLLKKTYTYILYAVALLSIAGMIKSHLYFLGIQINVLWQGGIYPWGTNLVVNYNNNALACILGIIAGIRVIKDKSNKWDILLCSILMLPIAYNWLVAGSRRGILFLLLCVVVAIPLFIILLMKGKLGISQNFKLPMLIWGGTLALSLIALLAFKQLDPEERRDLVRNSIYNEDLFTQETTIILSRYYSLVNKKSDKDELHTKLWGKKKVISFQGGKGGQITEVEEKIEGVDDAYGSRVDKYKLAMEILKSYNWKQWIIGDGFDYVQVFQNKFMKPRGYDYEDYPHNFYLSGLLYSGVLGLLALIIFSLVMLYRLIILLKEFPGLVVMVLAIWFNILVSYNSIFSLGTFIIFAVLTIVVYHKYSSFDESSITGSK